MHDWALRFLAFYLGVAEANAFAAFRAFSMRQRRATHFEFRHALVSQMVVECAGSLGDTAPAALDADSEHLLVPNPQKKSASSSFAKQQRCRACGAHTTKVCVCDMRPYCLRCFLGHITAHEV